MLHSAQFLIKKAFKEDVGTGDITTEALGEKGYAFTVARIKLKQPFAIVSGMQVVVQIINYYNNTLSPKTKPITISKALKDGALAKQGDIVLGLRGQVKDLLITERIILNFLQQLSGIATTTYKLVQELKLGNIKLLDTRKTTPGFRELEKYAVRCGEGVNHRMGLYDQYLIKDNHVDRAGGITAALTLVTEHQQRLTKKNFNPKIEIECRTLTEVKEVLAFNKNFSKQHTKPTANTNKPKQNPVAIIMLDNFSLKAIAQALSLIDKSIKVEVSGNINLQKIKQLIKISKQSKRGIDYVSAGMITHSTQAVDYSMTIDFLK